METSTKPSRLFRTYVGIMLTLSTIFLAGILVILIYGGIRLKDESKTITDKVNSFNGQVQQINTNLQNIDRQLQVTHIP